MSSFSYLNLKHQFFYTVYEHIVEHDWPHKIVVYDDPRDSYYSIVAVMFYDEKGYFRSLSIPLPIIQRDAEDGNDTAKTLLEKLSDAKRVPRALWGRIPSKDVYEMI